VLRHLIVVVPGIGGSVLVRPDGSPAWNVDAGRLGYTLAGPARLSLTGHPDLLPDRLIDTTMVIPPVWAIGGYDTLRHNLRRTFGAAITVGTYQDRRTTGLPAGLDVLQVPYDFRRSVAESADTLGRAVTAALAGAEGRRVIVVAHSLGGLVARYWIGPGGGARHVRALLTLGTPHRGAPKALDWLVNGAALAGLRSPAVTRMLRGWPSVAELLPQYPAVLHTTPDGARGGQAHLEPTELPASLRVWPAGQPGAAARFREAALRAGAVHRDIAAAWAGLRDHGTAPTLVPYFTRGHATANRATLTSGRLTVTTEDPEWRGNVGWRGDGTVPALSAWPPELNDHRAVFQAVTERHGSLPGSAGPCRQLKTLLGQEFPIRGRSAPDTQWLGLDVDDLALAGRPGRVSARLLDGTGTAPTGGVGAVGAELTPHGSAHPALLTAEPASGGGWDIPLPPMPAGRYELRLRVNTTGGDLLADTTTSLAVLDPDTAELDTADLDPPAPIGDGGQHSPREGRW
jgi:hypothetical protein